MRQSNQNPDVDHGYNAQAREMLTEADADGDGVINFNDFKSMLNVVT